MAETIPTLADLLNEAAGVPGLGFEEGDVPVLVTAGGGSYRKVPRRLIGGARAQGYEPIEGEALAELSRKRQALAEQEGIVPALLAGTEAALGTASFGLTDAAIESLAQLTGATEEEAEAARRRRAEGSPIASAIGTAVGVLGPAILSAGVTAEAQAAKTALTAAKAVSAPTLAAMKTGQLVAKGLSEAVTTVLPKVATAEELGAAFKAARAAGGVTPQARAVAGSILRTAAERAVGGAVEGALWGAGAGVRETIIGDREDIGEALAAHMGADALLFAQLGGGLGVIEAGLPGALHAARKVADRFYDAFPVFGRSTLRETWQKKAGATGVRAETAEELLAQRERLVALDERLPGVLDSMAVLDPEGVRAAASHVDALEVLHKQRRGTLDAVLQAPPEIRDAILQNATSAVAFEARAKGTIDKLLATTPDRVRTAFADGAAFDALVAGDAKAVDRLLELRAPVLEKALGNVEGLSALETITGNKALQTIALMPNDVAEWYITNAGRIAQLEAAMPGYWRSFRGITEGAESTFAAAQADDLLNNWRQTLTNPNERLKVEAAAIEQKAAEIRAGDDLVIKLYETAKAAEGEGFLKVGEIGGPPSIEGVQAALLDIAAEAETLAGRAADAVKFDEKLGREISEFAESLRRDFIGVTEKEAKAGIKSEADLFQGDPEAAFYRIKEQRTKLDDRIRELKSSWVSLSTAEKDTVKLMDNLRDVMTARYHDPTIFGEAASIRARSDDAARRWWTATEQGGLFDKTFRTNVIDSKTGKQVRVIARPRVNQWLNQMGDPRAEAKVLEEAGNNSSAWNAVSDAFINMVRTTEEILPKVGQATAPIDRAALESLARRTLDATEELERRGYYSRMFNQLKIHVDGGGLNMAGYPTGSVGGGGFPHGVATAGTSGLNVVRPGAPEAAAIDSEIIAGVKAAASVVPGGAAAADLVQRVAGIPKYKSQVTARVRGMVALEKRAAELADKVESGARWLVRGAAGGKALVAEARRELSQGERKRPARARAEAEIDEEIKRAALLASDPGAMARRVDDASRAVAADLPETTAATAGLMQRAAGVLAKAAPVPDGMPLDVWQPSTATRASYERVRQVISDPTSLYRRALDGTLTAEEVATAAAVLPRTMARMRAATQAHIEAARVEGRTIPMQQRQGLETLLGYPLTRGATPASIRAAQSTFGAARAGRTERPTDNLGPMPGASRVTIGQRFMTPQQAAGARA